MNVNFGMVTRINGPIQEVKKEVNSRIRDNETVSGCYDNFAIVISDKEDVDGYIKYRDSKIGQDRRNGECCSPKRYVYEYYKKCIDDGKSATGDEVKEITVNQENV